MAIDPPWRLDPFKNIVGVGWGGGNVLVLRIDTLVNLHDPHLTSEPHETTIEDLHFVGAIIDAYAETIDEDDGHVPVPEIVNPMSKDMRGHVFMWNHAPFKFEGGEEVETRWKAIVFLNLTRIKSFLDVSDPEYTFTIHFPEADRETGGGTTYWAFSDPFGNPFEYYRDHPSTTGAVIDADGHTGIVNNTIPFGSNAARAEFLGWNAGSLPPWNTFDEPSSDPARNDGLQWIVRGSTYKKRNDFPLGAENAPAWDEGTAIGSASEHAESVIGTPIPEYVVTVTVNLETLSISMSKA